MITVYTKPNCVRCNATKKYLTKKGAAFEEAPLNDDVIKMLQERGITSAPGVVVTTDGGAVVDVWGGYNPAKIRRHALSDGVQ